MQLIPFAAAVLAGSVSAVTLTGDVVNGVPVISSLDLASVPPQTVSKYYMRAGELNGGHPVHVPIMVARGTQDSLEMGKRLSLSAAINGDQLNPVRVVQRVFEQLQDQVATLNGTIIGIPTANPIAIYMNQRSYFTSSTSGYFVDVNRMFPGSSAQDGGSAPAILAYNIWNQIWANTSNVDVAIDLHTPSTGLQSSLWCYSDFRLPYVERLAKLLQPDTIKIDGGEDGTIESTLVEHGIPAITVQMGQAKVWNNSLIDQVVDYVNRVMIDLKMTPTNETVEPDLSNTNIVTTIHDTLSQYGGFVETLVSVDEPVTKGQPIAHIRNPFGDIIDTVHSPETGHMIQIPRDPSIEPGGSVGQVAFNSTNPECADGCFLPGP